MQESICKSQPAMVEEGSVLTMQRKVAWEKWGKTSKLQ